MLKLFSRNKKKQTTQELTKTLSVSEQTALRYPGSESGPIPLNVLRLMERDSMIHTALGVKRQAVLAGKWELKPANDSPTALARLDFVKNAFEQMAGSPYAILEQALEAFSLGWSVQEMVFKRVGNAIQLEATRPKDPGYFGLDFTPYGQLKGLTLLAPEGDSKNLPLNKFVVYRYRSNYANPKGRSDLESAYPHWKARQALLKAWEFYLQRHAAPTVLAKYKRGIASDEVSSMLTALRNLKDNQAMVYPEEIEIDTLVGQRETVGGFLDAIEFHTREIARTILGQTLTTDEGRRVGSLALGKIHLQVLLLQVQAIRNQLADEVMTEQVIRPLIEFNFGPGNVPKFVFEAPELAAFQSGLVN